MRVVVDACSIALFQRERVNAGPGEPPGPATVAVKALLDKGVIVFDLGGKIEAEWLATAGHPHSLANLKDWIGERLQEGKIRLFEISPNGRLDKQLRQLGMWKSRDRHCVQTAVGSKSALLCSEDIDFFDPPSRRSDSRTQQRVKESRRGCVCSFLRNEHGVAVSLLASAPELL